MTKPLVKMVDEEYAIMAFEGFKRSVNDLLKELRENCAGGLMSNRTSLLIQVVENKFYEIGSCQAIAVPGWEWTRVINLVLPPIEYEEETKDVKD